MPRDYSRLLRPKSIAVLGSGWAANVIAQCEKIGFAGDIWPVHPTRQEIGGRPCFTNLDDLPEAPDATFIGVNRHATLQVTKQLSDMGAGGAICFASGWAETGDTDLQADLVAAAGDMPILGPNCYGLLNMLDGAVIWPDQHGAQPCQTGVAILSQSSNIAINLTMQKRGLPVAYVACLGNAAQTGLVALGMAMLADNRVTALGVYAEGLENAAGVARLANEARQVGKGIVILKSGKSEAGAAAAVSHTAALSGTYAASQAFLRQAGIGSVNTLAELIETLKILHVHGPLHGRRVCALSCSGGEAGLASDLAEGSTLNFAPLSAQQDDRLGAVLGPLVSLSNPLDYHTFIWGDLEKTTTVFAETLRPYDAGLYIIDPPRKDLCDPASFEPALQAIGLAQSETGKPAFAVASMPENIDEERALSMMQAGVVPLNGLETALAAVEAASAPAGGGWAPWGPHHETDLSVLDEASGKALLHDIGIDVPAGVTGPTLAGVAELANKLRPPFALKGFGFTHKTEAKAVRLGITELKRESEINGATGYLLEEMVTDAVAEIIVGLQRDPVFGATLLIGFGGVQAELLGDTQTLVLPVTAQDLRVTIDALKLSPLLYGYRSRPLADVDAIIETVLKLQFFMEKHPEIIEVEINPLIVRETGAVAVDALIRKEKP